MGFRRVWNEIRFAWHHMLSGSTRISQGFGKSDEAIFQTEASTGICAFRSRLSVNGSSSRTVLEIRMKAPLVHDKLFSYLKGCSWRQHLAGIGYDFGPISIINSCLERNRCDFPLQRARRLRVHHRSSE